MLSQAPEEVRQDHVCVILLQNWTMAVDANIRITLGIAHLYQNFLVQTCVLPSFSVADRYSSGAD